MRLNHTAILTYQSEAQSTRGNSHTSTAPMLTGSRLASSRIRASVAYSSTGLRNDAINCMTLNEPRGVKEKMEDYNVLFLLVLSQTFPAFPQSQTGQLLFALEAIPQVVWIGV